MYFLEKKRHRSYFDSSFFNENKWAVSLSLTFLLLVSEKSSRPVTSFPGPDQLHPSFQGLSVHQSQSPSPGLATVLFRELSYLLIPMPSLCASSVFYGMINCSHIGVSTFCKFLSCLSEFLCLYNYISTSLGPSLISWPLFISHLLSEPILDYPRQCFLLPRTLGAAWLSGLL